MAYLDDHLPAARGPLLTRHFAHGKTDPIEYWEAERLRAYWQEALRDLLRFVVEHSPFYRAKFRAAGIGSIDVVTLASLGSLPATTRQEVALDPWALVTATREKIAEVFVSTGTSGAPDLFIVHTYTDLFGGDLAPAMPILVPLEERDLVVNALPYEMSSAGLSFHRVFTHGAGAAVFPAGKDGCYGNPARTRQLMRDLRATVLITSPSYAVRMLEVDNRPPSAPEGQLKFMWLTGEACSPTFRRRLEAAWGCPAYFYYGSLECGCIGIECTAQNGLHVTAGHVIVEITDAVSCPVAAGEVGEIVVTVLLRRGMPLVRYRTGDLGYIEDAPCVCGIGLPRLVLRGRHGDHVRVGGRMISPIFIEEILMRDRGVGFWYQIRERGKRPIVEVVPHAPGADQREIERRLESRLEYHLGERVEVRSLGNLAAPKGKVRRVIREGELQ